MAHACLFLYVTDRTAPGEQIAHLDTEFRFVLLDARVCKVIPLASAAYELQMKPASLLGQFTHRHAILVVDEFPRACLDLLDVADILVSYTAAKSNARIEQVDESGGASKLYVIQLESIRLCLSDVFL